MNILFIIIFIAYFLAPYQLFALGTYGVTASDIAIGLFIIIFFKKALWDGEKFSFAYHNGITFLFILVFAAIVSGITPLLLSSKPMIIQYLKTSLHLFFFICFPLICSIFMIKTKSLNSVIKIWLVLGFLLNLFGIYQIIARAYDLPLAWLTYTNISMVSRVETSIEDFSQLSLQYGDFFRATSIFSEPSALAVFNVYMIVFLIIPYIQNQQPFFKSKLVNILFFTASFIATFLTFSMSAFIGIILVIGSIILFEKARQVKLLLKILIAFLVVIVVTDYIVYSYSETSVLNLFKKRIEGIVHYGTGKKETTLGESFGGRLATAKKSIILWESYPINGIGLGLTSYNKQIDLKFSDFSIFAALAEMGIIGFLTFTSLFAALFVITIKFIVRKEIYYDLPPDEKRLSGLLYYLMLIQFLINFITGNNLVNVGLWIPMALIYSALGNILILKNQNVKQLAFVSEPLKLTFSRYINKDNEKMSSKL